ncbi:hypothetical protein KEM09_07270 [Carboxylicivirga mesophila]|uniref:SPOR domain-containing protein n=1 Tax=Carboxylicivirga mesophila TaxID=1166478 RepID=A0ABS5K8B6_9BACT|nr:hypothetical protein [Carboxylicivirga mesophila]MBS2211195.1 hypothetical protein [Carboxylicivirga mesophila]
MNKPVFIAICTLVIIFSTSVNADNNELKKILSSKEIKRIESAEKLIAKGDALLKETQEIEDEINALKNAEGRIKSGKINKRNKKVAEIKVKASLYYQDGYKRYIDVLDDHIRDYEKSGNSQASQARDDVKALEKKARKLYNKAENKPSAEKMIEFIELAQDNQKKAIDIHSKCLINLSEIEVNEEELMIAEEVVMQDTVTTAETQVDELVIATVDTLETQTIAQSAISDLPEGEAAPAPLTVPVVISTAGVTTAALPADSALMTEAVVAEQIEAEVPEEMPELYPDVFFTIQIMADKKPASNEQLKAVYSGQKEVIEMKINDWYKYSVGRYQNLDNAKADMQAENIKGFIVAYNKNERISVKEAETLLNGD